MDKTGFMANPGSWLAAGVCIGVTVAFPLDHTGGRSFMICTEGWKRQPILTLQNRGTARGPFEACCLQSQNQPWNRIAKSCGALYLSITKLADIELNPDVAYKATKSYKFYVDRMAGSRLPLKN